MHPKCPQDIAFKAEWTLKVVKKLFSWTMIPIQRFMTFSSAETLILTIHSIIYARQTAKDIVKRIFWKRATSAFLMWDHARKNAKRIWIPLHAAYGSVSENFVYEICSKFQGWKYNEATGWQPQFTAHTGSTENVKLMLDSNIQAKRKSDKQIVISHENDKCATLRLHKQRKSYNLEQKEKFLRKLKYKCLKNLKFFK